MTDVFGVNIPEAGLLISPIVTFGAGMLAQKILPYEWERFRESNKEQQQELDDWYDSSKEMVSRTIHVSRRATVRTEIDYEDMTEELVPLSERMLSHANTAPPSVHEEAIDALKSITTFTTVVTKFAEIGEEKSGLEIMNEMTEIAERQKTDELDIEDVERLVEAFGDEDSYDLEIDENQADMEQWERTVERLQEQYGDAGLQDIDDYLNLPWELLEGVFEEEVWNDMVREIIRGYIQTLLVNLGENAYEVIERHQTQSS